MKPTAEQLKTALDQVQALAEAIRESRSGIASGNLYAVVMGHMSLDGFTQAIELLKRTGLVTENVHHVLTWAGPALEVA